MRLNYLLAFGMASLLMVGCNGETSVNQTTATPVAESVAATPQPVAAVKQESVKSGTFVSGEHPTQGTARLVTKNGTSSLELDETFRTSQRGPDLFVILHRSDNVIGSTRPPAYALRQGDYAVIAPLQKFNGAQRYPIPNQINLADYKSAAIWCRRFNATFGAATLN